MSTIIRRTLFALSLIGIVLFAFAVYQNAYATHHPANTGIAVMLTVSSFFFAVAFSGHFFERTIFPAAFMGIWSLVTAYTLGMTLPYKPDPLLHLPAVYGGAVSLMLAGAVVAGILSMFIQQADSGHLTKWFVSIVLTVGIAVAGSFLFGAAQAVDQLYNRPDFPVANNTQPTAPVATPAQATPYAGVPSNLGKGAQFTTSTALTKDFVFAAIFAAPVKLDNGQNGQIPADTGNGSTICQITDNTGTAEKWYVHCYGAHTQLSGWMTADNIWFAATGRNRFSWDREPVDFIGLFVPVKAKTILHEKTALTSAGIFILDQDMACRVQLETLNTGRFYDVYGVMCDGVYGFVGRDSLIINDPHAHAAPDVRSDSGLRQGDILKLTDVIRLFRGPHTDELTVVQGNTVTLKTFDKSGFWFVEGGGDAGWVDEDVLLKATKSSADQPAKFNELNGFINDDGVRLRSDPEVRADNVLLKLTKDLPVTVIGDGELHGDHMWLPIRVRDTHGWVVADYVTIDE